MCCCFENDIWSNMTSSVYDFVSIWLLDFIRYLGLVYNSHDWEFVLRLPKKIERLGNFRSRERATPCWRLSMCICQDVCRIFFEDGSICFGCSDGAENCYMEPLWTHFLLLIACLVLARTTLAGDFTGNVTRLNGANFLLCLLHGQSLVISQ